MISRRALLLAAGAAALPASLARPSADATVEATLTAAPGSLRLGGGVPAAGAWLFDGAYPGPVLRVRQGQRLRATLVNRLPEPTSIHWHGIRLPNEQDGVPGVTQPPVLPGERWTYEFAPPDAGTYWYHPHLASAAQVGRGLAGALVVAERVDPGFDADLVLVLKDWRLDGAGRVDVASADRAAARAGTFGSLRTVDGSPALRRALPGGASVRLRLVNADPTRIMRFAVQGARARVLAVDGNPLAQPWALDAQPLGPGMRMDIGLVMPGRAGAAVALDEVAASEPWPAASLVAASNGKARPLPQLRPNPVPLPDAAAIRLALQLGASPEAAAGRRVFWSLNGRAWGEGDDPSGAGFCGGEPLARLRRGATCRIEIFNATPFPHPMHLHGHTFRVEASSERPLAPYLADSVVVAPKERITVAFVADNPGTWMLHCHVLEHQATGMMGVIAVA